MHQYFPHTREDISKMLEKIGVKTIEELFVDIPREVRLEREYALPLAMSEIEARRFFAELGMQNKTLECFAGAGYYNHYSPAVINAILSRSEFLTSYTPYQGEISQGTLQYIFEYQSMISALTGMEVSNASMYDSATATAEAVSMAISATKKKNKVLISSTVNPAIIKVVETYAKNQGITTELIDTENGETSKKDFIEKMRSGDVAGVVVAQPNFYGIVEDYSGWADECHNAKSLFIMNCIASTLGVLKTPAEWGADIAVGEGQSLGIPLSYGGPYIGFLATKKSLIRKMPGRIVGMTKDVKDQRAFVLTLQAREQHIRREKATSNICSNQSLMALYVTIYLSLMGAEGLKRVNEISYSNAHYLAKELEKTGKVTLKYPNKSFLNEFVIETSFDVDKFIKIALDNNIFAGVKLSDNTIMVATTETLDAKVIEKYIDLVKQQ